MVLPAGTNCITEYEDRLRLSVAASAEFQLMVNDSVTTETRVHVYDLPKPAIGETYNETEWNNLHPYCLIQPPESGENVEIVNDASVNGFSAGFRYKLTFEMKEDGTIPINEELRILTNHVGKIFEELQDTSRVHGLGIDRMSPSSVPSIGVFNSGGTDIGRTKFWDWLIEYRVE